MGSVAITIKGSDDGRVDLFCTEKDAHGPDLLWLVECAKLIILDPDCSDMIHYVSKKRSQQDAIKNRLEDVN